METTSNKLSDRLKDMLLTGSTNVANDNNTSRPLIQVIDDKKDVEKKMTNDTESDDELPPDIFPSVANTTDSTTSTTDSTTNTKTDPARLLYDKVQQSKTLTEQMLADAKIAKKEHQEEQSKKEQQRAKKSNFGMKKGFLNSKSSSGSKSKKDGTKTESNTVSEQKKVEKVICILIVLYHMWFRVSWVLYLIHSIILLKKELIYELDSDGNKVQPKATTSDNNIKQNTDKNNPLHLPEVQSAMTSHLQTNSEQWATPDLLDSITQNHPKLAQGMQNPQYMAALSSMQTNPKETLERLKQTSPEIVDWLMELCGVMGEHFVKLGENGGNTKERKVASNSEGSNGSGLPSLPSQKIREIGPLEKKALEKHQKESKDSHQPPKEDEDVSAILGDEELHSILLDPKMQEVMRECSKGNKLNYYMSHPEYGAKLRRLVQAKLMQVA